VIAHGMLSMAFFGQLVGELVGGPLHLAALRARFRAVTYPGDTVTVTGEVAHTEPCEARTKVELRLTATRTDGTVTIDGGSYTLYTRPTSGTGGSRCPGVSSWTQFYSVRQTARQCGQISVSHHFNAWAAAGMTLGSVLEAKVLIEVGGGIGSIDFTTANVTAQ